jgi:hypothetical protein
VEWTISVPPLKIMAEVSQAVSLVLVVIYSKSTKLAKIHIKACLIDLTAFFPSKLTESINLKNLAPLYF